MKVEITTKRKESVDDLVEDFDSYSDDGFDNPEKPSNEDEAIIDEVEEEDTLKMIEAEICNTALAKQDIGKVRSLISKIDEISGIKEQSQEKKGLNFSGSFTNKTKPIDQQTKFSSSSKVVVSKYNKSSSKTNLHDNSLSGSLFAQKMANKSAQMDKDKIKNELDELENSADDKFERAKDQLEASEEDIDALIQKHLDSEEAKKNDDLNKAKEMLAQDKVDAKSKEKEGMVEEVLSPSESDESDDFDETMTPKQSLIHGLIRLGDPRAAKYSL